MRRGKKWPVMLLALMLMVSLSACGGGSKSETTTKETTKDTTAAAADDTKKDSDETIELSFWSLGTTNYEELGKEYSKEHPNITIKFQNTSDQAAHHNNLTTSMSAGSGAPDIFMLEIGFMERFITAEDKFYNLNDLGAKDIAGD